MADNSSSSSSSNSQLLQHHQIEGFFCLPSSSVLSEDNNDLSFWEFINPSDVDSDLDIDIDNLSVDSFSNGLFVSWQSSLSSSPSITPNENHPQNTHFDRHDDDLNLDQDQRHVIDDEKQIAYDDEEEEEEGDETRYDDDDEEEEEDVGGGGYDLDDELVPWSVSGKLGRHRMRKLGKRAFARMNYSKKSPFLYMKPGCVHGKHGLGLKHSC